MKQTPTRLLFPLFCVMLSSCGDSPEERALMAQWGRENARLAAAQGERVFEKYDDMVFSAIMLAWTHAGLEVERCERAAGFIIAEGRPPLPADEAMALDGKRLDAIGRARTGGTKPPPAAGRVRVTATLTRLGKTTTKVNLRVAVIPDSGAAGRTRPSEGYPPLVEAIYKTLWQRLDRQLFVQEHLIHRRHLLGTDPNM